MYEHRIQEARIGQPRGGKTFGAEALAHAYVMSGRGSAFLYNKGMPKDFSQSEMIRPLTMAEHHKYFFKSAQDWKEFSYDPRVLYFQRENGDIHHFKDFSALFWGKEVSMKRVKTLDRHIFRAVHDFLSCCLFIIDDIAGITRYGVSDDLSALLSSNNHSGEYAEGLGALRGTGIDVVMMFHGLDKVNPEVWNYVTNVTLYPTKNPPKKSFIENEELEEVLNSGWHEVRKLPKYSAISYFLAGDSIEKTIIKPSDVISLKKTYNYVKKL